MHYEVTNLVVDCQNMGFKGVFDVCGCSFVGPFQVWLLASICTSIAFITYLLNKINLIFFFICKRLFGKWLMKSVDLCAHRVDLPLFGQENFCAVRGTSSKQNTLMLMMWEMNYGMYILFLVSYLENGWWKVCRFGVLREWTSHYLIKKTFVQ